MKKKVLAVIVFAVLLAVAFVIQQLSYPKEWDRIQLGMSRQQVYELAGPPSEDTKDIKGAFWYEAKPILHQELGVYFEEDKVTSFHALQHIGTSQHFIYTRNLRSSYFELTR